MKVMHFITGMDVGGAEHMLLKVLPKLKEKNFVVSLTKQGAFGKQLEKTGIKVYELNFTIMKSFSAIKRFRQIIKAEKPDIINSYLIHSNIFARLFGRLFGVRKIICSVRNKHIDRPFLNLIDTLTQSLVTCYTPNSEAVADFIIKKQGISKNKVIMIPNGIDLEQFNIVVDKEKKKKELGIKTRYFFSCIAKFEIQKGHRYLLLAVKDLQKKRRDYTLVLIGDGSLKKEMEELSASLGIQKQVIFTGKRFDVKEILMANDFTVLPSLYEGMSNTLLEAMACHCPVVCTDIPENLELVGKDAITVAPKTVIPLADAMDKMLEKKDYKRQITQNNYKKIMNYSIDACVKRLENLYKKLYSGN
jgi:glycosyltransferase involved in cell wall biosynthesis